MGVRVPLGVLRGTTGVLEIRWSMKISILLLLNDNILTNRIEIEISRLFIFIKTRLLSLFESKYN